MYLGLFKIDLHYCLLCSKNESSNAVLATIAVSTIGDCCCVFHIRHIHVFVTVFV